MSIFKKVLITAGAACAAAALIGCGEEPDDGFVDPRDGKRYGVIRIGGQTWMRDNLNYQTGNSRCYEDDSANCDKYGRLYDWNTAISACPAGWRLPADADWDTLVNAVGGWETAGTKLKSTDWEPSSISPAVPAGTNEYHFKALPGGTRFINGNSFGSEFFGAGQVGAWWSATEDADGNVNYRSMINNGEGIFPESSLKPEGKNAGLSVRCVK